ncbi:MAG TPA: hypothetical protein VGD64_04165 [Acidisarcina sp.]
MYCAGCGQLLATNQQACGKCGKPVNAAAPVSSGSPSYPVPYPIGARVQRHIQSLGYVWIAYACWSFLQVAVAATFFTGMSGMFGSRFINPMMFWSHFPFYNAPWLVPLITIVTVGRAILSGATGVGLLTKAPWGRTLALVAAFLTVLKPITGTAVAVYTFWVLMPAPSRAEYEAISLPTQ